METTNKNIFRRACDKLFGGINMSWLAVIIFAVASAAVTAAVMVIPVFKDTSIRNIGATFEAWILFAVIIMSNCKKPLESALKTFVFFLISQPLIYLFQVPFADLGWGLFNYYYYWFIWTLFTFPMAFVGWFIKKKNWLSLLIFAPVFAALASMGFGFFTATLKNPPKMIIAMIFCFAQILLYIYAFFDDWKKRLVGIAVPVVVVIVLFIMSQTLMQANISRIVSDELPKLSSAAVVELKDDSLATIDFQNHGDDPVMVINANKYGKTELVIKDGKKEYRYNLDIQETEIKLEEIK